MTKSEALLVQYEQALGRLQDVFQQEKNEFIRDSAVQRFEFTFDLSWKLLKALLEEKKGVLVRLAKRMFLRGLSSGIARIR